MDLTEVSDTAVVLGTISTRQPARDLPNEPTRQPKRDLSKHSDMNVHESMRQPKRQRSDEFEFSTDSENGGVPLDPALHPATPPPSYSETIGITSSPEETSRHFTSAGLDSRDSELLGVYNRIFPGAVSGEDFVAFSQPEELEPKPEPETWSPPPPPEQALSVEQDRIFQRILAGKNTFFTGPAGSGKSLIVAHLKHAFDYPPTPENFDKTGDKRESWCLGRRRRYAVTAPTGIAAVLIGGSTIHSWSGVGLGKSGITYYLSAFRPPPDGGKADQRVKPWLSTDVLILDEVSMLNPDLLELLNAIGKHVRKEPYKPFGGIQVICSGDFFQLPPVEPENMRKCAACGV